MAPKKKYRVKDNGLDHNMSLSTISVNSNTLDNSLLTIPNIDPPSQNQNNRTIEVHDLSAFVSEDNEQPKKEYKFDYSFNDYLRMFLVRILPLKQIDMKIIPEEKTLTGPQAKCEKLLKNIKNQIQLYAMKIVKYKNDADIEVIQFNLEKKYDLRIYTQKSLLLNTKFIIQHYRFEEAADQFIKRISSQKLILIRVNKKDQTDCLKQIENLMTQQNDGSTIMASPNTSRVHYERSFHSGNSEQVAKTEKHTKQQNKQMSSGSSEEVVEDEDESFYQSGIYLANNRRNDRQYSHANFRNVEEPTEDDSVSVAGRKKANRDQRRGDNKGRGRNQERERYEDNEIEARLVKQYEFESGGFDKQNFKSWLKNCRDLTDKNIKVIQKKDPYDENFYTHTVQLFAQGTSRSDHELTDAVEVYLKFRKVVFVNLHNRKYRDQLIQKYSREDDTLKVLFVYGYKSPKWAEAQMWKKIIKQEYSDVKKSANTEYFELFFLQGLKNLVLEIERQIRQQIDAEPKDDLSQELLIKLPQLSDHIRTHHKLKDMIIEYLQKMISSNYKYCCEIESVDFALSNIKIVLKVKIEQQEQYNRTVKEQISEKIKKEVKIREFNLPFKLGRHTYDKLEKVVVIINKKQKSFEYVSSILNMEDIINKINSTINSQNNIGEKQLLVEDKIIVKKINEQLDRIVSEESEFTDIKYNYSSDLSKFKFYGRDYLLDNLLTKIQQLMISIQEKRINYFQIAKSKQADLLQKDTILTDVANKYNIIVHVKKTELPCKIIVSPPASFKKKTILIIKSKSLDYAPCGSVIAFRSLQEVDLFKDNYFMKTFRNYINKHKTQVFNENTRRYIILLKQHKSTVDTLNDAFAVHPNPSNTIVMIMPEKGKESFTKSIVKQLLENKKYESRQVTIMIVQYGNSADLLKQLNMPAYVKGKKLQLKDQKVTKYYVEDKGTKFYYSESGNRKIMTGKEKGFTKIILNNEDLDITHISHSFSSQSLAITHLQSHKQVPIKVSGNKVYFELKNQSYEIPVLEGVKITDAIKSKKPNVELSLGVYEIDLSTMMQTNLFSDYQRKLCTEDILIKAEMNQEEVQTFYNAKISQIQYLYYFDEEVMDNFQLSRQSITSFLQNNLKEKEISYKQLKNIEISDLQGLKTIVEQGEQTEFTYNSVSKTIMLKSLDQADLSKSQRMIDAILKIHNERDPHNEVKYPDQWEKQNSQIEIIEVKNNTKEFADVQKHFAISKIKSLHRIQNKIIYKKYFQESIFLESLNGGKKVKTMRLFHGTRSTNPEDIYKDKEQSFNINYSSDNNLLGKGIYFAEKAAYSNGYRYTEIVNPGNIFGIGTSQQHSMFLCEVLVGQSEKCQQHSGAIKDTKYRDPVNKIKYESMTDFLNNSNIYVVYKSRRAYPLYLIKY